MHSMNTDSERSPPPQIKFEGQNTTPQSIFLISSVEFLDADMIAIKFNLTNTYQSSQDNKLTNMSTICFQFFISSTVMEKSQIPAGHLFSAD